MGTQELVELQKIKKLLKKQIDPVIKRAKKTKWKDLFKAENLTERINNFVDRISVADGIQFLAFITGIFLVYPIVYKLKPKGWWAKLSPYVTPFNLLGFLFLTPIVQAKDPIKFDGNVLAISIMTTYVFIYHGGTVIDIAKGFIAGLT